MSRLDIDFAAAPRRGPSLLGLALLLAGAAALTLVTLELDDLDQQTVAAEAKLKSLTRGLASAAGAKSAGNAKDAAGTAAGEVLAQLRAPWPELLEQLEAMADLPVAVLDLDAQARGRTLRLAGEAKTMDEVLAFVEKLRQSKRLDDVFLQGHEARKVGAVDVIAFTVQATWPATRDSARDAAR
jgi:Tfp pilus assembly protein PilN